jgi:hypothetical protein
VIPTGYESERVAGIDRDAKRGDPDERPTTTDPGTTAGLFGRDRSAMPSTASRSPRLRRFLWIVVASAVACSVQVPVVQDGDIIFQTSSSSQSVAIQRATHSKYSHMGLIILRDGAPYVLETSATVRYTPLKKWIERGSGHHYEIKRLRNSTAAHAGPSQRTAPGGGSLSWPTVRFDIRLVGRSNVLFGAGLQDLRSCAGHQDR